MFKGNRLINCMCHSTENLFNYRTSNLLRAADDFYPSDDASQPVHLAHVAYNSLFLGEIGTPDWDMFTSTHKDAGMHAAARAVSGGPLYVSDRPGKHDPQLLQKLVLPDGTQLRCKGPGRPTRDALFTDPNTDGASALKIWNRNAHTGVVAAFNVQGSSWDRAVRAFAVDEKLSTVDVTTTVSASDVEGLVSAAGPVGSGGGGAVREAGVVVPVRAASVAGQLAAAEEEREAAQANAAPQEAEAEEASGSSEGRPAAVIFGQRSRELRALGAKEAHSLTLAPREWELFTVSPVAHSGHASFAPLGLVTMLNGGGAIVASALTNPVGGAIGRSPQAIVSLSASDTFGAYCSHAPRLVRVDGRQVDDFEYCEATGMLTVTLPRQAEPVELIIDFPRGSGRRP